MRSLVLTLSCLVLMNSQAAAPQSTADENFLGYIGPTTDAEWEATPTLTLEMPKPPSNTVEFCLLFFEALNLQLNFPVSQKAQFKMSLPHS